MAIQYRSPPATEVDARGSEPNDCLTRLSTHVPHVCIASTTPSRWLACLVLSISFTFLHFFLLD